MNIQLEDGQRLPRGLCNIHTLPPCHKCGQRWMDNYPPRWPVWSEAETHLVHGECWSALAPKQNKVPEKQEHIVDLLTNVIWYGGIATLSVLFLVLLSQKGFKK